jgi:hypothetical protein
VTASDAELAPLLAALGVAVEKHLHGGANYNVVHNSAIYVLDPNAEWLAVSTGPHDPKIIATDYLRIRQRYSGTRAGMPTVEQRRDAGTDARGRATQGAVAEQLPRPPGA